MSEYVLVTDTAGDVSRETLHAWGVECVDIFYRFEGEERDYMKEPITMTEFYQKMRNGAVPRTSAANQQDIGNYLTPILESGKDVIFLVFSSGLSTTYNTARLEAEELKEKYPQRKITVIDTVSASVGLGLLVYLAAREYRNGMGYEQMCAYVHEMIPRMSHWFTVDDLIYLKRGGRISAVTALVGNTLAIKPILRVDMDGMLLSKIKVPGRKQSMRFILQRYDELALEPEKVECIIGHADCLEDAQKLNAALEEKYGHGAISIQEIGPVIGSHVGPGMLAMAFVGKER